MPDTPAAAPGSLRIRMYRVGFGDCFLVSFTTKAGDRHILVDCGVHPKGDIHLLKKVVDHVAETCNKQLSLVVATHAHQDHISGFGAYDSVFRSFSIGEVWMPWTEDPKDAQAIKLRNSRMALIGQLDKHFSTLGTSYEEVSNAVENLKGNARALAALNNGFGVNASVRWFAAGQSLKDAAGIPGLSVDVLGPSKDPKFLGKMNPPQQQRYVVGMNRSREVYANVLVPFTKRWRMTRSKYGKLALILSPKEERFLRESTQGDPEALALVMDKVLNNTSLVLQLKFGGHQLLFPGDAQWGDWLSWEDRQGEVLKGVEFYKVSHHGSFNATPKDALELMPGGKFAAMVSTQNVPQEKAPFPTVPQEKLMSAIARKTANKVVRSDWISVQGIKTAKNPGRIPKGFTQGEFWVDYFLS